MPNRILKQSICTSPNINSLSVGAETFFYRLLVQCDDYGQFFANASILRALCFPMKIDKVSEKAVEDWLGEIVRAGLAWLYEVEGVRYLQISKWDKHQQIRAKKHKFPQPLSDDSNGNQLLTIVPVIQSNPIQSNPDSEPAHAGESKPKREPKPLAIEKYHEFTKCWPNNVQSGLIVESVTDLEKWEGSVKEWMARGYNPKNAKAILDWYKNGIPPAGPMNGTRAAVAPQRQMRGPHG